jgi:protein-tyrosine phosphatase
LSDSSRGPRYNANVPEIKQFAKAAAKRVFPEAVLRELQQYRTYEKVERPIYLKMRILHSIGVASPRRLHPPQTSRSFLFVCFGNIMRSPMCEALMNRAFDGLLTGQIKVTSAGLNAVPGRPAHPWAVMAAHEFGISLEKHRARILTSQMVEQADAIFTMDYQNHVQLLSRWAHARKKVFMLSAYAGENYRPVEIYDPYYMEQEATTRCYQILQTCIHNLVESLPVSREPAAATDPGAATVTGPYSRFDQNRGETPCK